MNLKNLGDDALLKSMNQAVQAERDSTSVVLHHLKEIDQRRLYSKLKYQSLKDYAVNELKYTDSEAWTRIAAMQLLKDLPEIESKIADGSLNLSNLAMAKRALGEEARKASQPQRAMQIGLLESARPIGRSRDEKLALIKKLENVSKREAVKIIERETGLTTTTFESVRELSDGRVELKAIITKETEQLIKDLKGLLAHSHPTLSSGELLKLALTALKKEIDPSEKTFPEKRQSVKKVTAVHEIEIPKTSQKPEDQSNEPSTRYIPTDLKRMVWQRDQGKCTNCKSTFALQFEHILPIAKGGRSSTENLKLLCRHCNQRSAIESFGRGKMSKYLKAPAQEYFA